MGAANEGTGRVLGDFALKEKLGAGAYGAVYRAEQIGLGREAVVKIIHRRGGKGVAARFVREVLLASKLDHPFAAHVYAHGAEADGTLWIAMEMVRGESLDDVLKREGRIPLAKFLPLLERLGEVIQSAHDQGIIHRDIKPSNVMVMTRAGRMSPKLIDLGIAKAIDELDGSGLGYGTPDADSLGPTETLTLSSREEVINSHLGSAPPLDGGLGVTRSDTGRRNAPRPTAAGSDPTATSADAASSSTGSRKALARLTQDRQSVGSPPYMAPEQWVDAANANAQSDQYGLAILCYECLTGETPFVAPNVVGYAAAHAGTDVPPLGPGLPVELDAVFRRALAKRQYDRYGSVAEFVAAFRKVVARQFDGALPQLRDGLRRDLIARAPAPLAETVSMLESQVHLHDARATARLLGEVLARWVGTVATACHGALPTPGTSLDVEALLEATTKEGMTPAQWIDLAAAITIVFADRASAFPVPELVLAFYPADGRPGVARRLREALQPIAEDVESYRARLEVLADAFTELAWVCDYAVVLRRERFVEHWNGVRRTREPFGAAPALPTTDVTLRDAEGNVACLLGPMVAVAAPSPGMNEELFITVGPGRFGMRQVAYPRGFERDDARVRAHLREALGVADDQAAVVHAEAKAPYRGLATFTAADADQYFGRELEVEAFVNRLRSQGFVAVVGPSGAGKSSFVQAGVIPSLPAGWRTLIVRPGATPIAALAARLVADGVVDGTADEVATRLRADVGFLRAVLDDALTRAPGLLLIVDQFEELVTLCPSAAERSHYGELLMQVADGAATTGSPVRVVLTLRDDYLVRAEQVASLRGRLSRGLQILTTPSPEDLQRILTEPARRLGYAFDDETLPGRIVEALADRPGALALLSFTASKLWEARDRHGRRLTRTAYDALGGVGGALAQHAEQLLESLPDGDRPLVREAFRHLVTADGTRAIISREELEQLLGGPQRDTARAGRVLDCLIDGRLLVASEGDGGAVRVEVIHEMLLLSWPRLVKWLREDAEHARMRDQLRAAARQWQERGRPGGLLWRAEALAEYRLWRVRYDGQLTDLEQAFGDASLAAERRSQRIRSGLLAVAIAALIIGLVILFQANRRTEAQRAVAVKAQATAQQLVETSWYEQGRAAFFDGDWRGALPFWRDYLRTRPSDVPMRRGLAGANSSHRELRWQSAELPGAVVALSVLPDTSIAAITLGGRLTRLTAGEARPQHTLEIGGDVSGMLVIDGAIYVRNSAGVTRVDPATGVSTTYSHPDFYVQAAVCGNVVATGGAGDGRVLLWSRAGVLLREHNFDEPISGVACSARGVAVLTRRQLWDVTQSDAISLRPYDEGAMLIGAPGGQHVAVVFGTPATIEVLGPDLAPRRRLVGHAGPIWTLRFSRDGDRLLSGDSVGEARVWAVADGSYNQLTGHRGRVYEVAYSAAGQAFTVDEAGTLRTWTRDGLPVLIHDEQGQALSLTTVGDDAIVGYFDGTVRRIAAQPGSAPVERPIDFQATAARVNRRGDVAVCSSRTELSQHGRAGTLLRTVDPGLGPEDFSVLAQSDRGGLVIGPSYGTALRMFPPGASITPANATSPAPVVTVAAMHDRDWFAAGTTGGEVVLWDGAGAEIARLTGYAATVSALAAHPTRPLLAAETPDHAVLVVDATTRATVATLRGHRGTVWSIAFSDDGTRLYSVSDDGSAREWDLAAGVELRALWGHVGPVRAVRPLAGGLLATAGDDRNVVIWPPTGTLPLQQFLASRQGVWALEAAAGSDQLTVLDPFGLRTWSLPSVTASDDAIRAWLDCAIAHAPGCTLE
jgi:serine/threonine protein kinase/WD40 repeat protein